MAKVGAIVDIEYETMNFDLGYGFCNKEQMDTIIRSYIAQFGNRESIEEKLKRSEAYCAVKDALTNKPEDPPGRLEVVRQLRKLLLRETESQRTVVSTD